MNYKKSYTLWWILFIIGFFVGFLPFAFSKVIGIVIIAVGLIQIAIFFRCPYCNRSFDRTIPEYCPHCGNKID